MFKVCKTDADRANRLYTVFGFVMSCVAMIKQGAFLVKQHSKNYHFEQLTHDSL